MSCERNVEDALGDVVVEGASAEGGMEDASSEGTWSNGAFSEGIFSTGAPVGNDRGTASIGDGMGDVINRGDTEDVSVGGGVDFITEARLVLRVVVDGLCGRPIRVNVISSSMTPAQSRLGGRR